MTARGLANAYAQTLGTVFTTESKPLEVEIVVAEVGATPEADQIYRLTYDGSVADERGVVVMGGQAEQVAPRLREGWRPGLSLAEALRLAVGGSPRTRPGATPASSPWTRWRPRCSTGTARAARSAGSRASLLERLLGDGRAEEGGRRRPRRDARQRPRPGDDAGRPDAGRRRARPGG